MIFGVFIAYKGLVCYTEAGESMNFDYIKTNLQKRGFVVSCFDTAAEAAQYLNSKIDNKTVAFGGSVTLHQMDLYNSLSLHNKVLSHWDKKEDENYTLYDCTTTDVYLSSVNAVALTGEIVNIDGRGNRIASMSFGHQNVYLVVGRNKLAETFELAVNRARNVAAPLNAKRLKRNTPCVTTGFCMDCASPERICRQLHVFWQKPYGVEMEIVLIDEDLGY